jgi:hypothetical protein
MTKQEQFLYVVQTLVLTNAIQLATGSPSDKKGLDYYDVVNTMQVALSMSERLSDDVSAGDAADEFCANTLDNLRVGLDKEALNPEWMADK